ncbi:MAG TPA: ThuA domain-containing protein, partial [Candidatus Sulfotelmatobacter sp.]
MRLTRLALIRFLILPILATLACAQDQPGVDPSVAPAPHAKQIHLKHVLVMGQTKGWEHESI